MLELLGLRKEGDIGKSTPRSLPTQQHRPSESPTNKVRDPWHREPRLPLRHVVCTASQLTEKRVHMLLPGQGSIWGGQGHSEGSREGALSCLVSPRGGIKLEQGSQAATTAWALPASTVLGICPLTHGGLL